MLQGWFENQHLISFTQMLDNQILSNFEPINSGFPSYILWLRSVKKGKEDFCNYPQMCIHT